MLPEVRDEADRGTVNIMIIIIIIIILDYITIIVKPL